MGKRKNHVRRAGRGHRQVEAARDYLVRCERRAVALRAELDRAERELRLAEARARQLADDNRRLAELASVLFNWALAELGYLPPGLGQEDPPPAAADVDHFA